ncbi:CoA pyrophosphatase [Propylenella binzhouense]|uniref:CoA pyrophosphatase n=1 Tax=Propylenella binzhouense TaxID=2555902 RepID=A0A964WSC8_9HYPH|nr:CoA pyrophosphatase [Propylenella binzhouense]MYZ46731.1 CoA pyrophosphatase [Propylenella binzhouense]
MAEPARYGAADFRRRVTERLLPDRGAAVGDHSINPEIADLFHGIPRRPAAVLVPVVAREPEATVILTTRTDTLSSHAGQIAFPGGRIDPEDEGPVAAALREAREEIGLDPAFVETLALGPDYLSGSGFHVAPVLALVRPGFRLHPNPHEVQDVFEVPLGFLMDAANHRKASRVWQGATRHFFEMPYGERYIWGLTAGILRALYERLYQDEPAEVAG